ncbi:MAG TPA: SLC13 family permease, partial [Thermoanaerobaculia bacterium]|nr:SLC13 family permease [Thermoanaerobaculia bacterium]
MRALPLVLFGLTYLAIAPGRIPGLALDRTGFALLGAVSFVAAGLISLDEAKAAVDAPTLALLFGMMVITAGLGAGGFFDWATALAARAVRSRAGLLWLVTVGSGLLSAVLVNDAVCLLATPLVVRVAQRTRTALAPLMFAVAMGSNAGSALTLSGNPQNMLVAQLSGLA